MLPWETSSPKPHFCLEIPKILKFILHSSKPGTHYDVFFNCWLPILLNLVFFWDFPMAHQNSFSIQEIRPTFSWVSEVLALKNHPHKALAPQSFEKSVIFANPSRFWAFNMPLCFICCLAPLQKTCEINGFGTVFGEFWDCFGNSAIFFIMWAWWAHFLHTSSNSFIEVAGVLLAFLAASFLYCFLGAPTACTIIIIIIILQMSCIAVLFVVTVFF